MTVFSSICVRRYLSESGEKEALRVLREQLRHQKRVTSDDVRLAVRAVASQGGAVAIPPDFPPSRWVLEFKRVHGFAQLNSFTFNAAAACGTTERLEMSPLRPTPATVEPGSNSERSTSASNNSSSNGISIHDKGSNRSTTGVTQVTGNNDNSSDDGKDKGPSENSSRSMLPMLSKAAVAYSGPRSTFSNEAQCQVQLQHNFSQRHRQQLQQQQRRAMIVDERRRAAVWPRESVTGSQEPRPGVSPGSLTNGNITTTGLGTRSSGSDSDVGTNGRRGISSMLPQIQQVVINNDSSMDEYQDSASNASSSNDKRGYKLSHTVPAETWEKAIAAVEQQGMSLRTAAKMYGVHFAALHRRVKKRTQGGQANGSDGYFHPNDEARIMRVVVARAELGVLMTFDELMRLVEAAALHKLPDISVDSARKLLTRFESRNAQSIRHIIDDWPPSQPSMDACSSTGESIRRQSQPYLEHPGFSYGPQSTSSSTSGAGNIAVAMAAAAKTALFVPPSRCASTSIHSQVKMNGKHGRSSKTGLPTDDDGTPNDRLIFVGPRARSDGDMVV